MSKSESGEPQYGVLCSREFEDGIWSPEECFFGTLADCENSFQELIIEGEFSRVTLVKVLREATATYQFKEYEDVDESST